MWVFFLSFDLDILSLNDSVITFTVKSLKQACFGRRRFPSSKKLFALVLPPPPPSIVWDVTVGITFGADRVSQVQKE